MPGYAYLGCYSDPVVSNIAILGGVPQYLLTAKSTTSTSMTWTACTSFCSSYKYAGIADGFTCRCGNTFSAALTSALDSSCQAPCSGSPAQSCGGTSRSTIFVNSRFGVASSLSVLAGTPLAGALLPLVPLQTSSAPSTSIGVQASLSGQVSLAVNAPSVRSSSSSSSVQPAAATPLASLLNNPLIPDLVRTTATPSSLSASPALVSSGSANPLPLGPLLGQIANQLPTSVLNAILSPLIPTLTAPVSLSLPTSVDNKILSPVLEPPAAATPPLVNTIPLLGTLPQVLPSQIVPSQLESVQIVPSQVAPLQVIDLPAAPTPLLSLLSLVQPSALALTVPSLVVLNEVGTLLPLTSVTPSAASPLPIPSQPSANPLEPLLPLPSVATPAGLLPGLPFLLGTAPSVALPSPIVALQSDVPILPGVTQVAVPPQGPSLADLIPALPALGTLPPLLVPTPAAIVSDSVAAFPEVTPPAALPIDPSLPPETENPWWIITEFLEPHGWVPEFTLLGTPPPVALPTPADNEQDVLPLATPPAVLPDDTLSPPVLELQPWQIVTDFLPPHGLPDFSILQAPLPLPTPLAAAFPQPQVPDEQDGADAFALPTPAFPSFDTPTSATAGVGASLTVEAQLSGVLQSGTVLDKVFTWTLYDTGTAQVDATFLSPATGRIQAYLPDGTRVGMDSEGLYVGWERRVPYPEEFKRIVKVWNLPPPQWFL